MTPAVPASIGGDVQSFRLQKICDTQAVLDNEITHHRQVRKKYKRAFAVTHAVSVASGIAAGALSSAGVGVSLSGIGVLIGGPLAGVAGLVGVVGAGVVSRGLTSKVAKHEDTMVLAESKKNSISELVSKALQDGHISDEEFRLILQEQERYYALKAAIRARHGLAPREKKSRKGPSLETREKMKKRLREIREEFGSEVFE
jgi:cAMP phosphodiesterase